MNGAEIAIIGLAGNFPGAPDVKTFWENLLEGKESIQFISEEEMGVIANRELVSNQRYVASRGGVLADIDMFDASFFGYTPKEAEIMDPQFRLLHECVWSALEDSGYAKEGFTGLIGLFAGASGNFQWQQALTSSEQYASRKGLAGIQFVERDFLPTLISYNLNLKGPSFNVQTACSTSLVAVHLACQSLLNGECDVALAGGVSVANNTENGYVYQDGSILSPDGHCRAFDVGAKGSIHGSGAGIVALKLLDNALADKDHIYAVIRGSAINNDGKRKVGFTAPSILGQVDVIQSAHRVAEVDPADISYIEAHGTGTELGDPVEVEALKTAFNSSLPNYCGIGSVKTNIGHLDAAAGVAGLIKTALALKYKRIPASLNFTAPNPRLEIEQSPFYVVNTLREWPSKKQRLAGVSSFGIGGTNAHVILEEAPAIDSQDSDRVYHCFPFSAKSKNSSAQWLQNFSEYLQEKSERIADVAFTLSKNRREFSNRGFVVAKDAEEVIQKIDTGDVVVSETPLQAAGLTVAFMFPGQGAQYVKMGLNLYKHEPFFNTLLNECFQIYHDLTQTDLMKLLYPRESEKFDESIDDTKYTQPLLFIFEYSLAKYLMHLGITPNVMIGHSIGEYVAACLSGVFSFNDGLKIIIKRASLIQALPKGAMVSISLASEEITQYLTDELSIAAINSTEQCVVSGPVAAIEDLAEKLNQANISSIVLKTSHAFHSAMMEPVLSDFEKAFENITLQPHTIPFYSNLSGKLITNDEVTSASYWVNHLRNSVKFSAGVEGLLEKENVVLIEVGPGNTLSNFVLKNKKRRECHKTIHIVRHNKQTIPDDYFFCESLCKLWMLGVRVSFSSLYEQEKRKKVSLPTYCFEKVKTKGVALSKTPRVEGNKHERNELSKWFYNQVWQQRPVFNNSESSLRPTTNECWIVFCDGSNFESILKNRIKNDTFIRVYKGNDYAKEGNDFYFINPSIELHYQKLIEDLTSKQYDRLHIVHAWNILNKVTAPIVLQTECDQYLQNGFYSIVSLIRAIGHQPVPVNLTILTKHAYEIVGGDGLNPVQATIAGLVKILPLEYKGLTCKSIDITDQNVLSDNLEETVNSIIPFLKDVNASDKIVALRGLYQWVPKVQSVKIPATVNDSGLFEDGRRYLVLGLGGMGTTIAKYLTQAFDCDVFIVHRSEFPVPEKWDALLAEGKNTQTAKKIKILKEVSATGRGRIHLIHGDATNVEWLRSKVESIEKRSGILHGVIHAAGTIDKGGIVQRRSNQSLSDAMSSKIQGTLNIENIFRDRTLDFLILFSSLGNELYEQKFGELAYCASNEFVDAYGACRTGIRKKIVINWCDWKEMGMSMKAVEKLMADKEEGTNSNEDLIKEGISPEEGIQVFKRVVQSGLNRLIIYPFDLLKRLEDRNHILADYSTFLDQKLRLLGSGKNSAVRVKPLFDTMDENVIAIWKDYLGHSEIGLHDNIFELGASSLDVIQINNILKSSLNIDVPVTTLFEFPTISSFLKHLKGLDKKVEVEDTSRIDRGISKLGKLKNISTIEK